LLFSIIIPTYNRLRWTKKCLNSLENEVINYDCEIIVIDDGSTDDTISFLKTFSYESNLDLHIASCNRRGPAHARNIGSRMSRGEVICFLDDDSIVQPRWFEELSRVFSNLDEQYASVKGYVKAYYNDPLSMFLEKFIHISDSWATNNIAFRKEVFLKADGFDENFTFAAWEDLDLGFRLEKMGYKRFYNEQMVIRHPPATSR